MKKAYASEGSFRSVAMKEIEKLPYSKFFSIQQVAIKGTPDKLGVIGGRFVAIEFKKTGKARRSALQKLHLIQINAAGGVGVFCYPENWDAVFDILTRVSKGEKIDISYLQTFA